MRLDFSGKHPVQAIPAGLAGWQEVPAPGAKQIQMYGLAASGLGMLLVGILLNGNFAPRGLLPTLLILALTMPVHELIHALSTPNWGLSPQTVIGVQKRKGLFMPYVLYDGEQPLWRFLLTGLTPTILLTVLPLILSGLAPLDPAVRAGLGFLAFFNVAVSGGDLFLFTWLITHLHLRSQVRQKGWTLYRRTEA